MKRKYLAIDIETAKDVPGEDFNWKPHRPLESVARRHWLMGHRCRSSGMEQPMESTPRGSRGPRRRGWRMISRRSSPMVHAAYVERAWV